MEMKECVISDMIIVSPLEVRQYLLDLPPLKEAYRREAVVYALRTLYPGTQDSTVFDYRYTREKTVGIAVSSLRLEKYWSYNKPLVSSALVAAQTEKDAVVICAAESWTELQVIRRGVPVLLMCAGQPDSTGKDSIGTVLNDPAYADLPVHIYTLPDAPLGNIDAHERCRTAEKKPFSTLLTPAVVSKCTVFHQQKTGPGFGKIFSVSALLLLAVIPGTVDIRLYRRTQDMAEKLKAVKNEYEQKRAAAGIRGTKTETPVQHINTQLPLNVILYEIHCAADNIRLDSITINGSSFKFEAENAQALAVLEKLRESPFFEDVTLYQAVPLETGGERFIISGKIKNE